MGLCLLQILSLSYKLLAQGHGLWQSLLPNPWSIEELFQDDNLLVSTKAFFFFLRRKGSTCFCGCFGSFPSVAKLRLSQGVKLSLGMFLCASKQNKELLCTGCTSWAFLLLSLCSKEQGPGFCISVKGKVTMSGGNPLSRDDPWWESQLLAPAACPWASHLTPCDVFVLAYLLWGPERFHSCP